MFKSHLLGVMKWYNKATNNNNNNERHRVWKTGGKIFLICILYGNPIICKILQK